MKTERLFSEILVNSIKQRLLKTGLFNPAGIDEIRIKQRPTHKLNNSAEINSRFCGQSYPIYNFRK